MPVMSCAAARRTRGLIGRVEVGADGLRSLTPYTPHQQGRIVPVGCAGAATTSELVGPWDGGGCTLRASPRRAPRSPSCRPYNSRGRRSCTRPGRRGSGERHDAMRLRHHQARDRPGNHRSMATAAIMTASINAVCQNGEMPSSTSPLLTTRRIPTANRVPRTDRSDRPHAAYTRKPTVVRTSRMPPRRDDDYGHGFMIATLSA